MICITVFFYFFDFQNNERAMAAAYTTGQTPELSRMAFWAWWGMIALYGLFLLSSIRDQLLKIGDQNQQILILLAKRPEKITKLINDQHIDETV